MKPRKRKGAGRVALPLQLVPPGHEDLDDLLLTLPCYEPAGVKLELTLRDVLSHIVIIGSSGSGKTTLLHRIWSDLIRFRSSRTGKQAGLLIIDAQDDHTVDDVRTLAAQAGRANDVRVLSPDQGHVNFFRELTSFEAVEQVASKLVSATNFSTEVSQEDAFWTEGTKNFLEAGLVYLLINRANLEVVKSLQFLLGLYSAGEWSEETKQIIDNCDKLVSQTSGLSPGIKTRLALARSTIRGWKELDLRTRTIFRSAISTTLRPFLAASALRYWDKTKGSEVRASDALEGKIVVVCTRAATEVETANLIGRLLKMQFYAVAQARGSLGNHCVTGLIMDEFHLAVTRGSRRWDDASNISTLRGKGVFVVAATQGLVQLDLILGERASEALLIHFSNLILMRSHESGRLAALAERLFGFKRLSGLESSSADVPAMPELVCDPGVLASLEIHQAFVRLANGFVADQSYWLVPLFLPEPKRLLTNLIDHDIDLLRRQQSASANLISPSYREKVHFSVRLWNLIVDISPRQMAASSVLSLREFQDILVAFGHRPTGSESLPAGWRMACLRMAKALPLSLKLSRLAVQDGILDLSFEGAFAYGPPSAFALRCKWRRSVYPSRLRRLSRSDLVWLQTTYPHLCSEIAATWVDTPYTV
jgi:hypothetical protein